MSRRLLTIAAVLSLSAGLGGCPGTLGDPAVYFEARGITPDGGPLPDAGPRRCDEEGILQLFASLEEGGRGCVASICHGRDTDQLDLSAGGPFSLAERLLDVTAAGDGEGCVPDAVYIDGSGAGEHYLIEKITERTPTCGSRMPLTPPALPAEDVACVEEWVDSVVAGGGS